MKRSLKVRFLALLISLGMVVTSVPESAFVHASEIPEETAIESTVNDASVVTSQTEETENPTENLQQPTQPADQSAQDADVTATDGESTINSSETPVEVTSQSSETTEPSSDEGIVVNPGDVASGGLVGPETKAAGDGEANPEGETLTDVPETWTVTFYNRDAEVHKTVNVVKGEAIGDQLPATIAREDYDAYWAIGEIVQGGQGNEIKVTGARIDATFVPEADTTLVPDYAPITFKILFYASEDATEPISEATVSSDSNYCLNAIPTEPTRAGYSADWVYSGGAFTNSISAKENGDATTRTLKVWAEYTQNVFTATFKVVGAGYPDDVYATDTYNTNDLLELPGDPKLEGKDFTGWFDANGNEYKGGEAVTSDLTLTATFSDQYKVDFVVLKDDGTVSERLSQYFRSAGEAIGTMPQNPFVAGKVFEKWVVGQVNDEGELTPTATVVTAETVIEENMTVVAVFRTITIYDITAEYYYLNDRGEEVIFNTDLLEAETHELPYTITAPATTHTDPDEVASGAVYYPETPTVTITQADFGTGTTYKVRFKYVPYTAVYDFVYLLKNLDGNGYTEIDRTEDVEGVLNSYVTPTVKTYDYAVLERAEGATISQASGQELNVYYTRKNFQLTYETNGGSYVAGGTYAYGSTVDLPATNPTRQGYTFAGWYSDPELTQQVTGSVTVNADTTLYAKWNGATVNYSIIIMKEQYDNATGTTSYVYENSRTGSGTVGTTVYAASVTDVDAPDGYEKLASVNGTTTAAGTGEDTAVEITADGSAVLKVYISLIRYTLVFNANQGTISIGGRTYTGSDYQIKDVVLGQEIGSKWPASSTEIYRNNRYFDGWTGGPSTYITKQYELVWNHVKNANSSHQMTYTASWDTSSYDRNAYYWLQQPDGTWAIEDSYTQIGLNTNNLGAKEIDGYTKHNGDASRPDSSYPASGNQVTAVTANSRGDYRRDDSRQYEGYVTYYEFEGHYYVDRDYATGQRYNLTFKYAYNFYYDRAQYQIDYYYGTTLLTTKSDIFFEADINTAEYNYTPTRPAGIDADYEWGGWYENAGLQAPAYAFDKMPGHNLVLYAKWIAPNYTVGYVDGENVTTQLFESETLEKYHKATNPGTPTKAGYTFDGWYTTADGDTLFDWNTQITADTTVYAHWSRNTLEYTVHYVDEARAAVAPDKTVSNPNFTVGQSVTEQAIAVAGYRPQSNSETITLADTDNEITFIYSAKAETTSYTVHYVIADGETGAGTKVAASKTVENIPGNTASVIELAAAVDYAALYAAVPALNGVEFFPDEVEKTLVLAANATENVLTFYYSSFKNAKITVNYVDMDGKAIADPDVQIKKVGNNYTLAHPPISGWEFNKAVLGTEYTDATAGTDYKITDEIANAGGLTFTLFYQKKVTVTAANLTKQYDGSALTLPADIAGQVTATGLPEGESLTGITLAYTNTDNDTNNGRINAGVAVVTPSNAQTSATNHADNYYTFRYINGSLEVTKINVTVRIEPDRWTGNVYDGTVKKTGFTNGSKGVADYVMISHEGYKAAYLNTIWTLVTGLDNVKYDASAAGLGYYVEAEKDVNTSNQDHYYDYDLALTSADMPNGDGNYSVSLYVRPGRLQILPKDVTVTTASAEKTYDGTALTKTDEYTVEGIVAGETYGFEVTGSQTVVGESDNTYAITWAGDGNEYTAKASNYNVTDTLGTLTVKPAELKITINEKTTTYNGEAQSGYAAPEPVTGTGSTISTGEYEITGLANGQVLTISGYTPSTGTDAGTYKNGSFEDATITVTAGEGEAAVDVTEYYTISTEPGNLVIEPAEVTLTAVSDTKTYNGEDQTISGFTPSVEGLTFAETVTASATGKDADEYTVNFSGVTTGTTRDTTGNYVVTKVESGKLTITPKAVTVTAASEAYTYDGNAHSNANYTVVGLIEGDAAITAVVTGSITFPSQSPVTNKLASYEFTSGNKDNYTVTTEDGELTMTNANVAITITAASQEWTYDGSDHANATVTVTSGSLLTGDELVATATGSVTNVADTAEGNNSVAAGYKIMHGTEDVTENYAITTVAGTLTITPKAVTITAQDKAFTYTGEAQSWPEYKVDGLVGSDAITAVVEGSITFPSESPVANVVKSHEFTAGTAGNYTVTYVDGKLTMTKAEVAITITAASDEWTYDGSAHTNTAVTVTSGKLLPGDTLVATASGSVTNVADTAANNNPVAEGYKIMHGTEDVTANYAITTVAGKLTIKPAAVTVAAKSEAFTYDGTAHSNDGYDVTGLVGDDKISAVVEGTITFPSQSPVANVVKSHEFTTGTAGNYTVSYTDGELTMTNAEVAITITAASDEWTYDGAAHDNKAVTVTNGKLFEGDELVATATGSVTNVADTAEGNNPVAAGYKIMHGTEDVTANYKITTAAGTLTINPKAVTVTAKSEAFTYDGTAHSNSGYDVTGLVGEDAISAVVEGSITFVDESPVTNVLKSYEFTTGTPGNYSVTTANGQLTMTKASVEITITTASQEWTYDGTAHTNPTVTVTEGTLLTGDTLVATATGRVTNVADTTHSNNTIAPGYKIMHGETNVTENYVITYVNGTLTINPAAVTVTAKSEEFTYDGKAHSNAGYDVTGLVGDDAISAVVTGSITFPSESPVTNELTSYEFTTGTPGNYTVTTKNGELTMTEAEVAITITAASDEWTYDGAAHENKEVTVTSGALLTGDTLVATATGSVTNVADTAEGNNPIAEGYKIMHGEEDVTANYTITAVAGTLTIKPKAITFTGESAEKKYTGSTITINGLTVDGLVEGQTHNVEFEASGIDVDTYEGTITAKDAVVIKAGETEVTSNYDITVVNGTLTITATDGEFKISLADDEYTYDAQAHANANTASSTATTGTTTYSYSFTENGEYVSDLSSLTKVDAGVYTIYVKGTNPNYQNVATTTAKLTINPRPVTFTATSETKEYTGSTITINGLTVDGLVEGQTHNVKFSASGVEAGTYDGTITAKEAVVIKSGETDVTANYDITVVNGTLTITATDDAFEISLADDEYKYDGQSHANAKTATSTATTGTTTYSYSFTEDSEYVSDLSSLTKVDAGEYTIYVKGTNPNYKNEATTTAKLIITKRAVTLTSADGEKTYDGTPLVKKAQTDVTVGGDGFVEGEGATYNITGSQTDVGESKNTFTYTLNEGTKADNYNITVVPGTLKVTKNVTEIIITADSGEKTYDGTALVPTQGADGTGTDVGYTYTQNVLAEGDVLVVEVSGTQTDAGESASSVTSYKVVRTAADGTETVVTDFYTFGKSVDGTLKVSKKAVTIASADLSKTYDGTPLVNGETALKTNDGWVEGQGVDVTFTGSQTDVGKSANSFTYKAKDGTNLDNYDITKTEGKLEVTQNESKITITADSGEKTYDGTALVPTQGADGTGTDVGYTYTQNVLAEGDELVAEVSGTQTDAGESASTVTSYKVIRRAEDGTETDVTSFYTFAESVNGTLTVNKKAVTIASADLSKTYDGTPLVNGETALKTNDGWIEGQGVDVTFTGSQTDVGDSANSFTYAAKEGTNLDNYAISKTEGTLKVTKNVTEIVITADSGEKIYDGAALVPTQGADGTGEDAGYTYTENVLAKGDVLVAEVSGTQTDAGESASKVTSYKVVRIAEDGTETDVTSFYTFGEIVDGILTVNKRPLTLTSGNAEKTYDGVALTNENVEGRNESGLTVEEGWAEGEGAVYTFTGTQTAAGNSPNAFTYTLNEGTKESNYTITKTEGTLTVNAVTDKVTVTITEHSGDEKYDGTEKTVTGYDVTSISNSLYTVADFTFGGTDKVVGTDAGTYEMELKATDFRNDNRNFTNVEFVIVDGTLEIAKRTVTLTSADGEKMYDGTALVKNAQTDVTVTGDGFAEGEGATYNVTGTQTAVGSSANAFTYTLNEGTKAANYDITKTEGTLTVTELTDKVTVTITENSGSEKYDGTEKTVTGYTVSIDNPLYKETDFTFNGDATVKGTDAGTYNMELKPEDFTNKSTNFSKVTFVIVDGTLEIAKRTVTLTSADDEKVYDGQPLTNDKVTVGGDGFAEGEGAVYDITGTQTNVGESKNTFTYTLNEGTKAENYDITAVPGTLKVTELTDKVTVTITENSGSEKYDGTEKTVTGYTVSIDNKLYTEADFSFGGDATVKGTDAGSYGMALKAGDFRNESRNFSNVEFVIVDGTLEIAKRTVTLTSADGEKMYDGTALVKNAQTDVTVGGDGFATGEGAAYDVTGTQTDVGESANAFTYTLNEGTKAANYDITKTEGTLKVTPVTDKVTVTITENSGSEKYDGAEKTVTGYTVEIDNKLYNEADFTFNGNDTVKGTDAGSYPMELKAADFTNNSKNFTNVEFVIVDGTLEIAKRTVTLTSADGEKMYDGTALVKNEQTDVTVDGDGFAEGEGATYNVTGTQTAVGSSANAFTYTLNEGTKVANYEITKTEGTLTVTELTDKVTVTITENSGSEKYDGTEKTVTGYTVSIDNPLYKETDFTFNGDATVKGTDAGSYAMELKAEDFTNNSKNFSDVTFVIVDGTLEIAKRTVTLTSADDEKVYDGQPLTNDEVTVGGDGFATGEGATYNVTGSQTDVGESENAFEYTLNANTKADNYDITVVPGTLKVTELTDKVTVTITENSGSEKYDGNEKTVTGYTVSIDNELYTEADFTFSGDAVVTGTDAGSYNMELKAADFTNTNPNFSNVEFVIVDGTLEIAKRTVTLTSADASKVYDGQPLTNSEVTVDGDGFAEGEGAAYDVTGTQTQVGSSANAFTYTLNEGTKEANYDITKTEGTLTVTELTSKVTVTITENSGSYTYDGTAKTVEGYTVSISNPLYTEADFTFSGNKTVTGTDAGSYPMELTPANFRNENNNFSNVEFVIVDGTLEIAKRNVTLTSADASKVYDGTALTNDEVTVGGDGFATGEGATYNVTGTQTDVGESANAFTFTLNEGTKAANYTITTEEGTLTVTPVTDKVTVTITENSGSEKYDGTEKTVTGYTVSIDNKLYTEADFSFSGDATVKGTDAGTYNMELVPENFTNTSENFSNVEFVIVDGTLAIAKRTVTLTSATDSKVYDGTALTNDEVTVGGDGFAANEGATCNVTGSQTDVGESENAFEYTLNEGTKAENYEITTTFGTLTVTELTDKVTVTITENSGSEKYDGTEKTVTGYTVKIDNALYTEADFSFKGDDTVKGTDAGTYEMKLDASDFTNTNANFSDVTFVIVDGTLEIAKRTVTLTSADGTKVYDGTVLVKNEQTDVTAGGDGFVTGEGAVYDITGTQTEVGESKNTFTYTLNEGTKAANYEISTVEGTLSVTAVTDKVTVTITENSGSEKYDGTEKTVTGYTVSIDNKLYTEADFTFSGNAAVKGTDAGSYAMELKAEDFTNTSANFSNVEFVIVDGTLEIAKRSVTLTSADDSKAYDGTALTNHEVTVGGDGFAAGEGASYDVTGTQTNAGESANTFTYTLNASTKEANYDITKTEGTLTVAAATDKVTVTITENSGSEKYDGTEKTVTGYTVEIDNKLYTERDFSFSGDATIKGTDAGSYPMNLTAADFRNESRNFSNVEFVIVDGTLEIAKRTVTLTSADDSKVYDGTALTNSDVTVGGDGFVDGEGAAYDVTGTQTVAGESKNTFTYTLNANTKAGNYDITTVEGTLTVTPVIDKVTVTITENSGSEKYDGSEKTVTGYTVSIDNTLYTEADFSFSGDATIKGTDAGSYPMNLTAGDFRNESRNFSNVEFVIVDGTLEIAKRTVTLTSADGTKVYDGTPLVKNEQTDVTVGGDGFVDGEGAAYDITGTQTLVGESKNNFTYTLNEGTKEANYDITITEGTLKVTDGTGEEDEKEVDDDLVVGKSHEAGTYGLGDTVTFTITGTNIYEDARTITFEEIEGVTLAQAVFENVAGGETVTTTATYVIAEADIIAQEFVNTVTAKVGNITKTATDTVTAEEIEDMNGHFTIVKDTKSTPANGETYAFDETIVYSITVTNDGNVTVTDITVTDELTGDEWTVESLAPEESKEFEATYTVTEEDLLVGKVANEATGKGIIPDPDKPEVTPEPGTKEVPTEEIIDLTVKADDIEIYYGDPEPELTVTGEGFAEGEDISKIEYAIEREPGDEPGTYKITVSGDEMQGHYRIRFVDGTLTIKPGEYEFTKGMGQHWMKGSTTTADFEVTRNVHDELAYGLYLDIEIDGTLVDKSQYRYEEGCVELYISAEYMETLAVGEHEIKALFKDGEATTNFFVDAKPEPEKKDAGPDTGDSNKTGLWVTMTVAAAAGLTAAVVVMKKKKDEDEQGSV